MCYCVGVAVGVAEGVRVSAGTVGDSVIMKVEVGGSVRLGVAVEKSGMTVTPGVLVGTFGTQSN